MLLAYGQRKPATTPPTTCRVPSLVTVANRLFFNGLRLASTRRAAIEISTGRLFVKNNREISPPDRPLPEPQFGSRIHPEAPGQQRLMGATKSRTMPARFRAVMQFRTVSQPRLLILKGCWIAVYIRLRRMARALLGWRRTSGNICDEPRDIHTPGCFETKT